MYVCMSTTNELELIRVVATAIINGRRRLGIRELLSATVSRSIRVGYCVVCVCVWGGWCWRLGRREGRP